MALLLQHVALSVRDIDRSADWYTRMLDLTLVAELDALAPMKVSVLPGAMHRCPARSTGHTGSLRPATSRARPHRSFL